MEKKITGETTSRLSELRKYVVSEVFTEKYILGGSRDIDGVGYNESNIPIRIVYYLQGIRYVDYPDDNITTFDFYTQGLESPVFHNTPNIVPYKDYRKENVRNKPKIDSDVFIVRQQLTAFENNYMLEHINNIIELTSFAGGSFFNIIKNT